MTAKPSHIFFSCLAQFSSSSSPLKIILKQLFKRGIIVRDFCEMVCDLGGKYQRNKMFVHTSPPDSPLTTQEHSRLIANCLGVYLLIINSKFKFSISFKS